MFNVKSDLTKYSLKVNNEPTPVLSLKHWGWLDVDTLIRSRVMLCQGARQNLTGQNFTGHYFTRQNSTKAKPCQLIKYWAN
jgi:hypothetical protein